MLRSTTQRSQISHNLSTKDKTLRQQRTATSNRTGGALSSAQTSTGQRNVAEKPKPRIFDDANVDVTPKPIFEADSSIRQRHGSALFHSIEGSSTPTDILSNASAFNTNPMMTGAQSFGVFPDSSSQISSDSNQQPGDSVADGSALDKDKEMSALFFTDVEEKTTRARVDDETYARINLSETSTFVLLDIPVVCISDEDPNIGKIKETNEKYHELCKNKLGNDSYVERSMNTFNDLPKSKLTQTEKITINEKETMCTVWDMYDSYNGSASDNTLSKEKSSDEKENKKTTTKDANRPDSSAIAKSTKSFSVGTGSGTILSESSGIPNPNIVELGNKKNNMEERLNYLENENFKLNAFFMERLLNQNSYQPRQAKYRGFDPRSYFETDESTAASTITAPSTASDLANDQSLSLEKLWNYTSSLTKDRNVSCIAWNKKNKDILAAGYGKFEFNDESSGLVCCWSLKNPEFPERFYKTEAGVTALAFAQKHANLLAVGLFNGNILVFDVRNNNTTSLISTSDSEHKHLSPVWHLKWTEKERANSNGDEEEMEVLMSVSTDGRVTQWMIRKGFESSDYLKLKRITNKSSNSTTNAANQGASNGPSGAAPKKDKDKSDGFISRHSGGLCFDIWEKDRSIYLCGTEEGFIHRCSTSYNEQYLDTYNGHTGPVYKILWSPFSKNSFLSASGDWTIRLWKADRLTPCLSFNSSTKSVYDICWSTKSATLFCCVNENAIEIWDLSKSTLDPIYSTQTLTKLTAVSYCPNSDSIIVGTCDGSLWVYAIKNLPNPSTARDLDDIIKQSLLSQLESIKIDEDDDDRDAVERHQLESLASKREEVAEEKVASLEEQKEKMDAFEAKIDKIKNQNAAILEGKTMPKSSSQQQQQQQEKKDDDSSSSDEDEKKK